MAGIYKITSPTGKVYIGQTSNDFHIRFNYYKKCKCAGQPKLYSSLLKHGPENHIFEIVEEFKNKLQYDLIDAYEEAIYKEYLSAGYDMLNTRVPGLQPKHSQATIDKIKKSLTGKRRTPESVKKGLETKIKNNSTGKGVPKPQKVKDKISASLKGKPVSKEALIKREETMRRLKIRERRVGMKYKKRNQNEIQHKTTG